MPELPEVETVRRGLQPVMEGGVIAHVDVRRPDLRRPFPERMAARLEGQRVERLGRRSKYILADLGSGETLIVHLGMSGRILVSDGPLGRHYHRESIARRHDHVVLRMADGTTVTFNDARRFGAMDMAPTESLDRHRPLAGLGPEPLGNGFHEDYLSARFRGKGAPVKSALLDQRLVAGLGNIYVCEALHRGGISPERKAGRISGPRVAALVTAIRQVLDDAIEAGGSSLRDFRHADGRLGYFQHSFDVYDREGQPCRRRGCDGTVVRIVQSGRSTFYCPGCQR